MSPCSSSWDGSSVVFQLPSAGRTEETVFPATWFVAGTSMLGQQRQTTAGMQRPAVPLLELVSVRG